MMAIQLISPHTAQQMHAEGAKLIDIREPDEFAREHIAGALHVPLRQLERGLPGGVPSKPVIYLCRSGNRTAVHADTLCTVTGGHAYVLDGGLNAWKASNLPTVKDRTQPLELNRQVQICAGLLIVAGLLLGYGISPALHLLSGFVGAGLIFAGTTGYCGMARVLAKMPWN